MKRELQKGCWQFLVSFIEFSDDMYVGWFLPISSVFQLTKCCKYNAQHESLWRYCFYIISVTWFIVAWIFAQFFLFFSSFGKFLLFFSLLLNFSTCNNCEQSEVSCRNFTLMLNQHSSHVVIIIFCFSKSKNISVFTMISHNISRNCLQLLLFILHVLSLLKWVLIVIMTRKIKFIKNFEKFQ